MSPTTTRLQEMQEQALALAEQEMVDRKVKKSYIRATIVSISELAWQQHHDWGTINIPACPPDLPYVMFVLPTRNRNLDVGTGVENMHKIPMCAREMALDAIRDLQDHGLFVAEGDIPTDAELNVARERRLKFYKYKLQEGDREWAKAPKHENIDDVCKRAAKFLGEKRPWAYEVEAKQDCPFCGDRVRTNVALCPSCKGVLDADKALAGGLISAEKYAEMRPPEKPRTSRKAHP